jgi:predicted porin
MKKTLLAAALFAGFAGFAGAAQAETQVTLYGILDTGLEFNNIKAANGTSYSTVGLDSGNMSGSRWGMKGTEDIGGGTQVTFQLESGFQVTRGVSNQGSRLFGRRAFLGLQNPSWGMVRVGRGPTISTDMFQSANSDPFGYAFGPFNLGEISTSTNTYRTDNQIGYMSPVFAGFQFGAGYSFNVDSNVADTYGVNEPMGKRQQGMDVAATYTNGPLFLGITYGQTSAISGATHGTLRQVTLDGSYDFQVLRVYGAYVRGWNGLVGGPSGVSMGDGGYSAALTTPGGNKYYDGMKQNAFMLGLSVPVGTATSIFATYQHQTLGGAPAGGYNATSAQNAFAVGANYNISKRTNVYGVVGYVNGLGNVNGQKETAAVIGMRHQF